MSEEELAKALSEALLAQRAPLRDGYQLTREVAADLRTPEATLRYWRHAGKGPKSVRIGRRVLYDPKDVRDWVEEQRREQSATTP